MRQVNGVRYIDDSKGTNVGATEAALIGLSSEGPIWLILGGQGKGQDFSQLQQVVSEQCAGLLVLGQAAAEITDQLGGAARIEQVDTLRRRCFARLGWRDLETQYCCRQHAPVWICSAVMSSVANDSSDAVQALEVASC